MLLPDMTDLSCVHFKGRLFYSDSLELVLPKQCHRVILCLILEYLDTTGDSLCGLTTLGVNALSLAKLHFIFYRCGFIQPVISLPLSETR